MEPGSVRPSETSTGKVLPDFYAQDHLRIARCPTTGECGGYLDECIGALATIEITECLSH